MDFMVISSCLTYFLLISNFVGSSTITTCCKYQSVLNLGTGQCEAHPSYEFEYDIFLPEWKIPTAFSENGEELETLRLVERAPWCKCTAAKEISLQFGKELGNKNDTVKFYL
ncbi:hypothetical protein Fcan01_13831 [Folsomia candida]|uniref:Uncharacterized protein n=1 Tax=Folsomia candida TaxID=158441 RepID=A0A226E6F7_FOLCA|nr:hypothetical protein Fcan01_13831 [Folsomia candida]